MAFGAAWRTTSRVSRLTRRGGVRIRICGKYPLFSDSTSHTIVILVKVLILLIQNGSVCQLNDFDIFRGTLKKGILIKGALNGAEN